ncbi:MAG: class I SAM-dependent methyltransferase [Deltaproteobacteria bacterium]|nr:class I SAM-dependent methyltransferase [Deltaproteobacteria bacterium]
MSGSPAMLEEALARADAARAGLRDDEGLEVYRLFHGYSEGVPGLEIDRYGDAAILTGKGASEAELAAAGAWLRGLGRFELIVLRERGRPVSVLHGTMPGEPLVVREAGLRYAIEPWAAGNPGLYLDARPARRWLQSSSEGRRVLNLFSFAGSLGVAALAGGAASVTHVDSQRRALERCAANHALNAQRSDARDRVREDVPRFLRRAARGERRFGGVILDPPPGPEDGAQRDALTPLALAGPCAALVERGGWILVFFHHDPRSWDELEEAFAASAKRPLEVLWRGRSGSDFPEAEEKRTLRLSAFRLS